MEPIKAVPDPAADPKTGKRRQTSDVSFPYFDLDTCLEVARVIHERAGGICDLPQLAALMGYSGISNGAFRTRVSGAKKFGFIENAEGKRLRITDRGLAVVAPESDAAAERARVEGFLSVELFGKVYERYQGATLPGEAGLRNVLEREYGVVKDRVPGAVRVMLDSAEQAGLFRIAGSRNRMVVPPTASRAAPAGARTPAPGKDEVADAGNGRRPSGPGGGDGGGFAGIDPAFLGLLRHLPAAGTPLSPKKRKSFIEAFTATVDLIYPEEDGE